jgi:hypothetical protein
VAIIGGTIVSTMLTLLVVPSFYDSIEIARERAGIKFRARAAYRNPFLAFLITAGEVFATLYFFRFFFRVVRSILGLNTPAEHPVERAARLVGFPVPPGFVARPKRWQHAGFRRVETVSSPPPEPGPDGTLVPPDHVTPPKPSPRWKPIKAS